MSNKNEMIHPSIADVKLNAPIGCVSIFTEYWKSTVHVTYTINF